MAKTSTTMSQPAVFFTRSPDNSRPFVPKIARSRPSLKAVMENVPVAPLAKFMFTVW